MAVYPIDNGFGLALPLGLVRRGAPGFEVRRNDDKCGGIRISLEKCVLVVKPHHINQSDQVTIVHILGDGPVVGDAKNIVAIGNAIDQRGESIMGVLGHGPVCRAARIKAVVEQVGEVVWVAPYFIEHHQIRLNGLDDGFKRSFLVGGVIIGPCAVRSRIAVVQYVVSHESNRAVLRSTLKC